MKCPHCNATLDEDTVFCGNCGKQVAPLEPGETAISYATQSERNKQAPVAADLSRRATSYGPPGEAHGAPAPAKPLPVETPPLSPPPSSRPRNSRRITLIAALILLILAGGTVGLIALLQKNTSGGGTTPIVAPRVAGQVAFIDGQNGTGHTDALKISVTGLGAPPAGFQYDAWLVNDQTDQTIALGTLSATGGKFSLSYAGDGRSGLAGTNLLGAGNKVEITLEQGNVTVPTGKSILIGTFPPMAFVHIRHLLFSFPTTPGKIGLLVEVLKQAQLLDEQALLLQNAAATQDTTAIKCIAQNMIDIIEGTQGAHYQPLPGICASQNITVVDDGFGLLGTNGYVSTASQHASLAAHQTDTTDNIRVHARHVEIAMNNITGWITTVEQDVLKLLNNPGNTAKLQQIVSLSDQAFHGIDINGDESIDPVPGEAGAITGYQHGQLMAALPLVPVA